MKKLIFLITFLLTSVAWTQVDTVNWSFKPNSNDGRYTMLQNKTEYLGKSAGKVVVPFTMDINAVDTSKWLFIPVSSDGTYRLVENTASFMGKDSGTVRASLTYGLILPEHTGTPTTTGYESPSYYYGASNGVVLGEPAKWIEVTIDGVIYIIPCYAIQ